MGFGPLGLSHCLIGRSATRMQRVKSASDHAWRIVLGSGATLPPLLAQIAAEADIALEVFHE